MGLCVFEGEIFWAESRSKSFILGDEERSIEGDWGDLEELEKAVAALRKRYEERRKVKGD